MSLWIYDQIFVLYIMGKLKWMQANIMIDYSYCNFYKMQ
jgi:hypothetical protein